MRPSSASLFRKEYNAKKNPSVVYHSATTHNLMVGKRAARQEAGIYDKSDEDEDFHPPRLNTDLEEIERG